MVKNCVKIDPLTVTQYIFELCTPRTNSVPASEHDRKKTNAIFLHQQLMRVV